MVQKLTLIVLALILTSTVHSTSLKTECVPKSYYGDALYVFFDKLLDEKLTTLTINVSDCPYKSECALFGNCRIKHEAVRNIFIAQVAPNKELGLSEFLIRRISPLIKEGMMLYELNKAIRGEFKAIWNNLDYEISTNKDLASTRLKISKDKLHDELNRISIKDLITLENLNEKDVFVAKIKNAFIEKLTFWKRTLFSLSYCSNSHYLVTEKLRQTPLPPEENVSTIKNSFRKKVYSRLEDKVMHCYEFHKIISSEAANITKQYSNLLNNPDKLFELHPNIRETYDNFIFNSFPQEISLWYNEASLSMHPDSLRKIYVTNINTWLSYHLNDFDDLAKGKSAKLLLNRKQLAKQIHALFSKNGSSEIYSSIPSIIFVEEFSNKAETISVLEFQKYWVRTIQNFLTGSNKSIKMHINKIDIFELDSNLHSFCFNFMSKMPSTDDLIKACFSAQ
jgi:hypothetical protein